MKLLKVLKYIKNYKNFVGLNILFIFLSLLFSVFSLALVIPFLGLIFGTQELVYEAPPLTFDATAIKENFYYYVTQIIVNKGQEAALVFICILVLIAFFLKNLFRYLAQFFMAPIRSGVVRDLRKVIYKKVIQLPLAFFSEKRKGDIIARMTNDVQEIEWAIMSSIEVLFKEPATIVTFLVILFLMSYQLTLFVLILLPITGFLVGRVGKSLKKTSTKGQNKMGELLSVTEETLSGLRIIKAFFAHKQVTERFSEKNDEYRNIFTRMTRKRDLSAPMSEFLGVAVMVVVIWFGGRLVLDEELQANYFIGYIVMFSQIIAPAKSFSTGYYNIQKGAASVERIHDLLDAKVTIAEHPNAIAINDFKNSIRYKKVSFAYEDSPVLNNINLEIKKGQTLAIVGQSGAGKSTLVDLLPRFYDIELGEILIDEIPIKEYKISNLRKLMGIVTQESILFNDTIFNNIAFGADNVKKEDVIAAAKIANAHEFITEMKDQYESIIGDRGNKLSGGQKQRITIARALLKNPPILLLDEATSSLDTESEKLVQQALTNLMKNRTTVVIAHRLSTIKDADQIIVMDEGKIVEKGNHDELLSVGGVYKKLYDLQHFE